MAIDCLIQIFKFLIYPLFNYLFIKIPQTKQIKQNINLPKF
jgi:hypothetical protein